MSVDEIPTPDELRELHEKEIAEQYPSVLEWLRKEILANLKHDGCYVHPATETWDNDKWTLIVRAVHELAPEFLNQGWSLCNYSAYPQRFVRVCPYSPESEPTQKPPPEPLKMLPKPPWWRRIMGLNHNA
jgi:hypothetical protein